MTAKLVFIFHETCGRRTRAPRTTLGRSHRYLQREITPFGRRRALPGSITKPFAATLLRHPAMAGTHGGLVRRLPRKRVRSTGGRHGKLSSFCLVEQLLHAGRRHHAAAAALAWHAVVIGNLRFRGNLGGTLTTPDERNYLTQTKSPANWPGFYLNPSNPFRRLRPPPWIRRHRPRHPPRRLRRRPRSPRPWRHGAGSWRAGFRFP
jgi:hypothetical protein